MHEKVVFRSAAEASTAICQICPRDGIRVDFYRRMVKSRREVFNVNDVRGSDADVVSRRLHFFRSLWLRNHSARKS